MAVKYAVSGDQMLSIYGKLHDIERQLRLGLAEKNSSPLDPTAIADALQMLGEGLVEQPNILRCKKRSKILTAKQGAFNSDEFFQTSQGLYVSNSFRDIVVASALKVESAPELSVSVFTLTQQATDKQIKSELPEGHVFEDSSIFCYHLAELIKAQVGGREGMLLNNGSATIFCVQTMNEVFAVIVRWSSANDRKWNVYAGRLGGRAWIAGDRVFSAAAVA